MNEPRPSLAADLDVMVADDGVIIYHATTDRVHHLNHTAGVVLALCDGERTPTDIAREMAASYSLTDDPLEEVLLCLERLRAEELID